jgi:hypothetical protein
MAQTAVKELICDLCGAEVRDGSLFCYNCGSAVSDESGSVETENRDSEVSSNGRAADPVLPKQSNRVRTRKRPIQNREVVWEGREDMSIGFVATTIVLVLVTVVIIIAGFYFR